MSFFKEWKFRAIAIVAILSLWLILFGPDFKKGMDVAGGVELTYQIDFSKYRAAYPKDSDYITAVQNAKNIIKNNITRRVNSMGVGDAEVKLLKVGDKDYIVVKVWGLTDIEVAKATIGKTVELEFKLPNTAEATPAELAARKKAAEDILTAVVANPSQMKQLADGRQSEDVYYEAITRSYDQLPQVYQDNMTKLRTLSWVANQIIEWVYGDQTDASGNVQTIKWFFIIKSNGFTTTPSAQVSADKIASINTEFGTTSSQSYVLNTPVSGTLIATGIRSIGSDLVLVDPLYPMSPAYRVTIYQVSLSGLTVNSSLIASLTWSIASGIKPAADSGYTTLLDDQWIDLITLQSLQTGLTINSGETIKIIDSAQGTIIVGIAQTKSATDDLQLVRKISGASAKRDAIVARLTTDSIYNIEQIFVKDTSSWKPAIESRMKRVLNGAYFQSAATSQGQAGLPVVTITFNKEGSDIFCNLTAESVGKQMAIFVGGKLVTSPVIRDKICGWQAQIDGQFTDQTCSDPKNPTVTHQAKDTLEWASCLVANLNEGALPAQLILSHEASLTPTLGANAWLKAGYATVLGLILVFALLWYMYGLSKATVAWLSLLIFLIVLLAFVKLTDYALSLSGIAAIILNIGMGVDSSILIFERLKEERDHGLKLVPAILTAYERSWAPILDGNVATGLIGFIMALVGSDIFQGFGFMMAINNLILLLFTVPLTKYLLLWWAEYQNRKS
jgi:protein-export membrane protein SecD